MRTLTVQEISRALIDNISMEYNSQGTPEYFLHITDDGKILPDMTGADATFTTIPDVDGLTGDWRDEFETLENRRFRDVCEDLARQANEYLEGAE